MNSIMFCFKEMAGREILTTLIIFGFALATSHLATVDVAAVKAAAHERCVIRLYAEELKAI